MDVRFPIYVAIEAATEEECVIGAKIQVWNAGRLKYEGIPYAQLKATVNQPLRAVNPGMVYLEILITVE